MKILTYGVCCPRDSSQKIRNNFLFSRPPYVKNDFDFFKSNFDPLKIRQHNIYPNQKHLRKVLRLKRIKKNYLGGGVFRVIFS